MAVEAYKEVSLTGLIGTLGFKKTSYICTIGQQLTLFIGIIEQLGLNKRAYRSGSHQVADNWCSSA